MVNVESNTSTTTIPIIKQTLFNRSRNRSGGDENKEEDTTLNRSGEKRSSLRQFRKNWLPFESNESTNTSPIKSKKQENDDIR